MKDADSSDALSRSLALQVSKSAERCSHQGRSLSRSREPTTPASATASALARPPTLPWVSTQPWYLHTLAGLPPPPPLLLLLLQVYSVHCPAPSLTCAGVLVQRSGLRTPRMPGCGTASCGSRPSCSLRRCCARTRSCWQVWQQCDIPVQCAHAFIRHVRRG